MSFESGPTLARRHLQGGHHLAPIQFYFDFVSPYAYLASTCIDALAARHGRKVDWRPVLIGVTVLKIMGLKPLSTTPLKGPYVKADLPRMATLLGAPYRHHGLSGVTPVTASRAYLWLKARDADLALRFARRIYERLWVRGADIGAAEACVDEAVALGVDGDELLAALALQGTKDALHRAVDEAVAHGVFGTPFFIVDGEPIWGVDRLWMLEHWLVHGRWMRPDG
jgi:2-hydroxychromene-2-carboxylate isomerase